MMKPPFFKIPVRAFKVSQLGKLYGLTGVEDGAGNICISRKLFRKFVEEHCSKNDIVLESLQDVKWELAENDGFASFLFFFEGKRYGLEAEIPADVQAELRAEEVRGRLDAVRDSAFRMQTEFLRRRRKTND